MVTGFSYTESCLVIFKSFILEKVQVNFFLFLIGDLIKSYSTGVAHYVFKGHISNSMFIVIDVIKIRVFKKNTIWLNVHCFISCFHCV